MASSTVMDSSMLWILQRLDSSTLWTLQLYGLFNIIDSSTLWTLQRLDSSTLSTLQPAVTFMDFLKQK